MVNYEDIKNKYILRNIFQNLTKRKFLDIVRYNKQIKQKIDISLVDYILFSQIEIEIKILPNSYNEKDKNKNIFINYSKENEKYYHIYFNGNKQREMHRNYLNQEDNNTIKE